MKEGSGNYPRCRVRGCKNRATIVGATCSYHATEKGRTAPSPRQMLEAADVLVRFSRSRRLDPKPECHVETAALLLEQAASEALIRGQGQATPEWVRCNRCGHAWDENDPDSEVCACLDTHGYRTVSEIPWPGQGQATEASET